MPPLNDPPQYPIVSAEEYNDGIRACGEGHAAARLWLADWNGRRDGARAAVMVLARKKFGPPASEHTDALNDIRNVDQLVALAERVLAVNAWDELLAGV